MVCSRSRNNLNRRNSCNGLEVVATVGPSRPAGSSWLGMGLLRKHSTWPFNVWWIYAFIYIYSWSEEVWWELDA
jgi:hypothetical protein